MTKRYFCILLLWISFYGSVFSQKALIHVKTKFLETSDIHFIKVAVIHAIDSSNWAKTVEVDEDVSLWLTRLKRTIRNDTTFTSLDLELRTPANLTQGKLLSQRRVSVIVPPLPPKDIGADSNSQVNKFLVNQLRNSKLLPTLLKMYNIPPLGAKDTGFVNILILPIALEIVQKHGRILSPQERLESTLLATTILVKTWDMTKQFRKAKVKGEH